MDALKCIYSRRSIRAYKTNYRVTDEMINNLLSAGCSAPSAHNGKPWEFIVIKERETIEKLAKVKVYYEKPLKDAHVAIIVLIDPESSTKARLDYKYQDCAAATQNILLAATAQGLGSCWMGGLLDKPEMDNLKEILEIPDNIIPFGLISIGFPDETKEAKGKIDESKVHYEKY
jgi:nitroreductase